MGFFKKIFKPVSKVLDKVIPNEIKPALPYLAAFAPFIETEASVRYETINGKRVPVITPKCEVTLTNTETGQEYMSDAEALADVQNANTPTKSEHIRRDVNVTVEEIKIGADFNISD